MATKTFKVPSFTSYVPNNAFATYLFPSSSSNNIPSYTGLTLYAVSNSSGKYFLTNYAQQGSCYRSNGFMSYTNFKWMVDNDYFDNINISDYSSSDQFILYFPMDYYYSDNYTFRGIVDVRNPIVYKISDSITTSLYCENGAYNFHSAGYFESKITFTYEESTGGGESSGGGSTVVDSSSISNAILMIPATLIVISLFSIIYRMFINRRTRG